MGVTARVTARVTEAPLLCPPRPEPRGRPFRLWVLSWVGPPWPPPCLVRAPRGARFPTFQPPRGLLSAAPGHVLSPTRRAAPSPRASGPRGAGHPSLSPCPRGLSRDALARSAVTGTRPIHGQFRGPPQPAADAVAEGAAPPPPRPPAAPAGVGGLRPGSRGQNHGVGRLVPGGGAGGTASASGLGSSRRPPPPWLLTPPSGHVMVPFSSVASAAAATTTATANSDLPPAPPQARRSQPPPS